MIIIVNVNRSFYRALQSGRLMNVKERERATMLASRTIFSCVTAHRFMNSHYTRIDGIAVDLELSAP